MPETGFSLKLLAGRAIWASFGASPSRPLARFKPSKVGRPVAAERAKLAVEKETLTEMKPFRKLTGSATRQSIRRTLRAALNAAIARQLVTFNPAAHVELESGKRPKPLLWPLSGWSGGWRPARSPARSWCGCRRSSGAFLDHASEHRLYALFHLIAFRGLRHGEGIGQDWTHVNLDAGLLTVASEIVQDGWTPYESEPKTDSSANTIGLDNVTVAVLRAHKVRQNKERLKWGKGWQNTGKIFTKEDGTWLHPNTVSEEFRRLYEEIGLPPINLRDLRHGTATLTHAGGGDLHTIKETLRHSTITLTSDTYTSLLPEVDKAAAEAAARLVPRARPAVAANGSSSTAAPASLPHKAPNDEAPRSTEANRGAK